MNNQIICQNCGNVDDYSVKQAGPHQSAYCNECDAFIKHLPQNNPVSVMPFGKYKGRELKSLKDDEEVRYLQWFIQMPDLKPRIKEAIQSHLLAI